MNKKKIRKSGLSWDKNGFTWNKSTFSWKKFIAVAILAAADVFVIAAPYYIRLIVPNINEYMGITSAQFAQLLSIIGWVTLATQLPGGWLADKVSSRKLLFLAVLSTGILTIIWGALIQTNKTIDQNQLFIFYVLIYVGWGVSTTLIFWTPLWKLVSQQAGTEDQGLTYGLQGSINGIIGLTLVWGAGLIATSFVDKGSEIAFPIFIYSIAFWLLLTSILVLVFVPEKKTDQKFALDFKNMWKVLKTFRIWLAAFFVMGMYMFQSVFAYYMLQLLTNSLAVTTIALVVVGGVRTYLLRFAISGWAGKFADKCRSHVQLLVGTLGVACIVALVFILSPGFTSGNSYLHQTWFQALMIFMYIFAGFLSWIMVTLRFAQINELPKPDNSYASVTAFISFIAFSPDAWFYTMSAVIEEDHFDSATGQTSLAGYQLIMGIAVSISFVSTIAGMLLFYLNKRELKQLGKDSYRWRELSNA